MKISEAELKQIIVEALQEEDLDEGIMDKIRGMAGGLKGVGSAATSAAKDAAGKVGAAYGKGSYEATKESALKDLISTLQTLKSAADKHEEDEDFKEALHQATDALRKLEDVSVKDPRLPDAPADPEIDAKIDKDVKAAKAKEKAAKADDDGMDLSPYADDPAAADEPAAEEPAAAAADDTGGEEAAEDPAAAEEKPQINVFRGKGGKGVQSQMAKAGIKGKDMSRIMKGLKGDLTGAGFDVLEEASRREISLEKTLKAIDQIADPAQKEAAKKIIVKLLKKNKVKVSDARLKKAAPAQEPASAKEPAKGEEYPEGHKMAGFTKPKRVEPKAETPDQKKKREEDEMWADRGLNEGQISRFAKLAGLL
jgi:hypothetical protein